MNQITFSSLRIMLFTFHVFCNFSQSLDKNRSQMKMDFYMIKETENFIQKS